ncbi:MAG: hypothetical protein MRERC_7c016 [Mycoplasmataceae bacterium RC_NB112A]|nr:MAG: hypothetical protein MRERC_7c016 [Mycoplasmataceae bacterium RC_NB112A]
MIKFFTFLYIIIFYIFRSKWPNLSRILARNNFSVSSTETHSKNPSRSFNMSMNRFSLMFFLRIFTL